MPPPKIKTSVLESVERFRNALQQAIDSLKTQTAPETNVLYREPSMIAQFKRLWLGVAIAILLVAAMTVWHLVGNPWGQQKPLPETGISRQKPLPSPTSTPPVTGVPATGAPAKSIMGKDGITMRLIPGGALQIETGEGGAKEKTVQVQPFYIDETNVTVHHFVDFLNSVRHELTVENGAVKRNGEIWLLLEDDRDVKGQIIYRHDRFHIPDLRNAGQPVVRVTWYGASAYARYFDKRLPTEYEWEYYAQRVSNSIEAPDKFGVKNMGRNMKEWVARVMDGQGTGQTQVGFPYPSLVIGKSLATRGTQGIIRNFNSPWEVFSDVGFRCATSLNQAEAW